jgi:hypothetical protein
LQDLVDQPVFLGRFGPQEVVAVVVALDLLGRAAREACHERDEAFLEVDDELRVALDIRDLALESADGW